MEKEKLKKANELARKIEEHERALECFEYDPYYYSRDDNPDLSEETETTNPLLIIEFDNPWEGTRETQKIPMVLSDFLIDMIKGAIKENLSKIEKEFNEL